MSESPPNSNNDQQDTTSQASSLWQQPIAAGAWRKPEQPEATGGWRVPAIPTNLQPEPAAEGAWHRPAAEDTPYTPEDTIDIRPEDELMGLIPSEAQEVAPEDIRATPAPPEDFQDEAAAPEEPTRPEDAFTPKPSQKSAEDALLAPEDLIHLIEQGEADESDFETVGWSELVALASLVEGETAQEGNGIPTELGLREAGGAEEEAVDIEMLSPAERMVMGPPTGKTEAIEGELVDKVEPTENSDPAAYARQQLERLAGGPAEEEMETDAGAAAGGTADPAAYARQQLQQLIGKEEPSDTGTGAPTTATEAAPDDPTAYARQQLQNLEGAGSTAPPPTRAVREELSPRDVELLRRFRETEEQVRQLRQQVQNGQISQDEFLSRLRDLMILDDNQTWWMMGVETDTWYKSENNQWVEAVPDVYRKEQHVLQEQQQAGGTEYGSLAYLPNERRQQQATQPSYGEYTGQPAEEDYMPLPREVPPDDLDYTMPSRSAFDMRTQPSNAATVPSPGYSDATVMAQPVGYGTADAVRSAELIDYGEEELEEGELYSEARDRQRRRNVRIFSLLAAVGVGLVLLFAAGFIALALLWYQGLADRWEAPIAALTDGAADTFQTVEILDNRGNRIATLGREGDDRRPVEIGEISPYMIHAVLTLEDTNFYENPGWDLPSIIGAFWRNLTTGEVVSGASTITQQVARALVLRDATFESEAERKLNEIVIANELTQQFSKAEILEFYLNDVAFFGNQTYGVEAAAQFYFDKPAAELTFSEAALLASVIQAPAEYEPIANREVALDRMNITMDRMAAVGCIDFNTPLPAGGAQQLCVAAADLTSPQTALEKGQVIRFLRTSGREFGNEYPHFITLVRNQLEAAYGNEMYRSGYVVTTTLDTTLQDFAQDALTERVRELRTNGVNTGALMVTDPRTGAILALVGSPDFNDDSVGGQEDKCRTYQQPGSAIKPIVYAMGLPGVDRNGNGTYETGEYVTPASILWDVPTAYPDGTPIENFDDVINGPISVRRSLAQSLNIPTVKLFAEYGGVEFFRQLAEAMGVRFSSDADFTPATALGATEVRLYDMMEAYGAISNDGRLVPLYTVERIVDSNGNEIALLPELRGEPSQSISADVAFLLQSILSDDAARQPQFPANSALTIPGIAVAAKTGTSDGSRDLWTMGFTTNRVVGAWLGSNDDSSTLNNLTGFTATAPLWNAVLQRAIEGTQVGSFTETANILRGQVCADTGTAPPGSTCANIVNEVFISNRRPPEQGFTVSFQVDSWTGLIANTFCPDNVIQRTYVNIDDATAINWLNTTQAGRDYARRVDIPLPAEPPPAQECDINTTIPVGRIASPAGGQTVQGTVQITGQVSAPDFARYEIQIAPGGTEDFQTISTSTTQQTNAGSTLATWDTTDYDNGAYTIRLAVFASNSDNGFIYRVVDVTINNPTSTPTPQPTSTPAVPTPAPLPTDPLPFDPLTPTPPPGGPTPTIDPLGD